MFLSLIYLVRPVLYGMRLFTAVSFFKESIEATPSCPRAGQGWMMMYSLPVSRKPTFLCYNCAG